MLFKRWYGFSIVILLIFTCVKSCLAINSINPFQGVWVNDYGRVVISNCEDKTCKIKIDTMNGAFTCYLSETLNVMSKTAASFKIENIDSGKKIFPINISLSKQVISISVPKKSNAIARGYCGERGFFEGEYTNSTAQQLYETSFNCDIAKTKVDVAICQSQELATADVVLSKLYFQLKNKHIDNLVSQQKRWIQERNACINSKNLNQCLLDKYRHRILWLQQNALSEIFKSEIRDGSDYYNYDYLLHVSKLLETSPQEVFWDPPLQFYLKSFLPKDVFKKILPNVFNEIQLEEGLDNSLMMIKGGSPGLYTICEGALVLTKNHQLWLAYINIGKDSKTQLFVYYSPNTNPKLMPRPLRQWLDRLSTYMGDKEIVYKKIFNSRNGSLSI